MSQISTQPLPYFAAMLVAGAISGLLGVGGGIVTVPVLEWVLAVAGFQPTSASRLQWPLRWPRLFPARYLHRVRKHTRCNRYRINSCLGGTHGAWRDCRNDCGGASKWRRVARDFRGAGPVGCAQDAAAVASLTLRQSVPRVWRQAGASFKPSSFEPGVRLLLVVGGDPHGVAHFCLGV
jgi:hypothetical protein